MWEWGGFTKGVRRGLMEGGYQCRYPEDTVWARRQGVGPWRQPQPRVTRGQVHGLFLRCLLTRRPGNTVLGDAGKAERAEGVGITGRTGVYPAEAWTGGAPVACRAASPPLGESAGRCRARRPWPPALLCAPRRPPSSSPALTLGLLAGMTRAGSGILRLTGISMFVPQDPHLSPGSRCYVQ